MVLIRTETTPLAINGSFGEIINESQDWNIKQHKDFWKKKKTLQNNKDFILFKQTCLYIHLFKKNKKFRNSIPFP